MQTLVDPFEAAQTAPNPSAAALPGARDSVPGGLLTESVGPAAPRSDVWERVRCWCSEE